MSSFLATFFSLLFDALFIAILGYVIMSWIDRSGSTRASQVLREIADPILSPIRSIMPSTGPLDFSPIIALLLLQLLKGVILSILT
jgi:YggT family protein